MYVIKNTPVLEGTLYVSSHISKGAKVSSKTAHELAHEALALLTLWKLRNTGST